MCLPPKAAYRALLESTIDAMLKTKLIDCGGGNISSAYNALCKLAPVNMQVDIITDADALADADIVVLPGQGEFGQFMQAMRLDGWIEPLTRKIITQGVPFLGICVGMQIMLDGSVENCPDESKPNQGLAWIDGIAQSLPPTEKLPQMGWNNLNINQQHQVFNGIDDGQDVYFVHSYGLLLEANKTPETILATADYGGKFAAMIGRDNYIGMQFHAEKSHHVGLKLIENFLLWRP